MTSSFSIYILIGLTYFDYNVEPFAAYIDSGSSLCLSKPDFFPLKYHENLPPIQGKDISNEDIVTPQFLGVSLTTVNLWNTCVSYNETHT